MNGVALSPTNQTVEGDDKTRIRALEQQLQQFQSEFQQFQCQFQQLQVQNESEKEKNEQLQKYVQSLESKLESHEVVQNGPWSKMFHDPTESKSSPTPKSAKKALKKICQKKCQGTGTKRETICAHVWPNHAWKKLKEMFNDEYNIHGEENLLLLCKDVEREFDAGRICLVLGVLQNGDKYFKVKVLNKDTGKTRIGTSSITFNDLENSFFDMANNRVSGTLLSCHSKQAIHYAFTKGWIEAPEKESLLAMADFCSPDCVKAQQVSAWLKSNSQEGSFSHPSLARWPLLSALTNFRRLSSNP